jgi:hypothetical protein
MGCSLVKDGRTMFTGEASFLQLRSSCFTVNRQGRVIITMHVFSREHAGIPSSWLNTGEQSGHSVSARMSKGQGYQGFY